jgi:hypothetical protein
VYIRTKSGKNVRVLPAVRPDKGFLVRTIDPVLGEMVDGFASFDDAVAFAELNQPEQMRKA